MDSYKKIRKSDEKLPLNEIRVKKKGGIGRYLKRAWLLLEGEE
jgi:hypothetical protein